MRKGEPTAEDWVIARLLLFVFDGSRSPDASKSAEIMKSMLHLLRRVGFINLNRMFKAIKAERGIK
jgi:hypothetical protein